MNVNIVMLLEGRSGNLTKSGGYIFGDHECVLDLMLTRPNLVEILQPGLKSNRPTNSTRL